MYKEKYEGRVYEQKSGPAKIVKYYNNRKIDVEFINTGTKVTAALNQVVVGTLKDRMVPDLFGVGYNGYGPHIRAVKSKITKVYSLWYSMLCRCYNTELHKTKHRTYAGVVVCKEWHNFQNFAEWWQEHYVEGWDLDKDILGGGIYSPATCMYVPAEVNSAEKYLRQLKIKYPEFEKTYNKFVTDSIALYRK